MITSRHSLGFLLATSFFLSGSFFPVHSTLAASPDATRAPSGQATRQATGSDDVRTGGYVTRMSRAAGGQWNDGEAQWEEPPLAENAVQPVGYFSSSGTHCGPVCDCAQCEVGCGVETVYGDPGCGTEIGCGLGEAIETVRSQPWWGGHCEPGCTDACCDSGEGMFVDDPVCGMESYGDCACDACGGCQTDHIPLHVPILRMNWCSFDFFYGHQGYTGPLNYVSTSSDNPGARSGSGSFGFYQGFNKGSSLKRWLGWDLSTQFGVRATQSNLSGGGFTRDRRYQVFVTGGVFRRVDYGLQYGLVLDYLNQDWYFQGDALQMRGELSWRLESCETLGFQFMAGVRNETSGTVLFDTEGETIVSSIRMEPTDQYRFFYRRPIVRSGQFAAFAGWTDHDDALLGSNFSLHLSPRLLLATDVMYSIPNEGRTSGGNEQECWNLAIGVIFRPGGSGGRQRYNLPLFDVADNGTFLIDRF